MDITYNKIYNKIRDKSIPDSEIIWDIEYAKCNDPEFDINWCIGNWTLLIHTIVKNRKELVKYLLMFPGINVNKYRDGYTTLYYACCYDSIYSLKLLLSHRDIDVNIQTKYGWTGLHCACRHYHIEIVKELLLDARINTLFRDRWERSARDLAIKEGCLEIANMLKIVQYTPLLRIPNEILIHDIIRMIIEEYM